MKQRYPLDKAPVYLARLSPNCLVQAPTLAETDAKNGRATLEARIQIFIHNSAIEHKIQGIPGKDA